MNKRLFRIKAMVLALLVVAGMLGGCSKSDGQNQSLSSGSTEKKTAAATSSVSKTSSKAIGTANQTEQSNVRSQTADQDKTNQQAGQQSGERLGGQTEEQTGEELEKQTGEETAQGSDAGNETPMDFKGQTVLIVSWRAFDAPRPGFSKSNDLWNENCQAVARKYNAKIEFDTGISATTYYNQLISTVMAGVKFADIAIGHTDNIFPTYIKQNIIRELTEYIPKDGYWQTDTVAWFGKVYCMKSNYLSLDAPYFTLYNNEIFEREGLPDLQELAKNGQWNWAALLDLALRATKDFNGDGIIDQWGLANNNVVQYLQAGNNVLPVAYEDGKYVSTLTQKNFIDTLQFMYDLFNVHKVIGSNMDGFAANIVAMTSGELWNCRGIYGKGMRSYRLAPVAKGPAASDYVSMSFADAMAVIPTTASFETGDLVRLYTEACNNWESDNPYYMDPRTKYIDENINYTFARTEDAEFVYDFVTSVPTTRNYQQGIGLLTPLQKIRSNVQGGAMTVGKALDTFRGEYEALVDSVLNER